MLLEFEVLFDSEMKRQIEVAESETAGDKVSHNKILNNFAAFLKQTENGDAIAYFEKTHEQALLVRETLLHTIRIQKSQERSQK